MDAWAGIAVAQLALLALAVWRVGRARSAAEAPARVVWAPGVILLVAAVLAASVMVAEGGTWAAIALFGTAVLAVDVVLLGGAAVATLCTRPAPPAAEDRDA